MHHEKYAIENMAQVSKRKGNLTLMGSLKHTPEPLRGPGDQEVTGAEAFLWFYETIRAGSICKFKTGKSGQLGNFGGCGCRDCF